MKISEKGKGNEVKYEKIEPKSQILEVKHNNKRKKEKEQEGSLVYHEQEHEDSHSNHGRHDKKVEGKEFKAALRLTFIRK